MATTGWIFNNFRETFDLWDETDVDIDGNESYKKFRKYKWYLERYAEQEGGTASVERIKMGSERTVDEIQCFYMGQVVNLAALANFSSSLTAVGDEYLSDGTGTLIDRVISYNASSAAGKYLITESWEGDGPTQYYNPTEKAWFVLQQQIAQ